MKSYGVSHRGVARAGYCPSSHVVRTIGMLGAVVGWASVSKQSNLDRAERGERPTVLR